MLPALGWLALVALGAPAIRAAAPVDVWLDVDTSTGISDVDDGLALIQAFHSPELAIRGISTVYGNAPLADATRIAREVLKEFGPDGLAIHPGAAASKELGDDNEAVRALASALGERKLTILALGPVTNIGTLLMRRPELTPRIERIVVVAGRRPGQKFVSSESQRVPHRDFNFENDPAAMQVILDSPAPLALAPWEVSSQVWIARDDLARLRATGGSGEWIADTSQYWIERWERGISPRGFNPFDTLAVGWVTHPALIKSEPASVRIETATDDRDPRKTKPYLWVTPHDSKGRQAIYCYQPLDGFQPLLMRRLAGKSPAQR